MRNDIELIDIVIYSLEKGDKPDFPNTGMCSEIYSLKLKSILSTDEENQLSVLLNTYNPAHHKEFKRFQYNPHYYIDFGYWFEYMSKNPGARQVRIDYLNALKTYLTLNPYVQIEEKQA